ncbi:MAG: Nif3-like dinuclear metal center hexameric protein [Odoribacter sp.]|nr:Nif3-like dinuclear metal center hexameric protein [Odoribacter sp.]
MKVKEITALIEEFAPLCLQEDYDNAGLLCGDFENEVNSILLSTDITEEVVEEAIADNHNLIISHHPLTLKGFKNLLPNDYTSRALIKAIKNNINIYSAHTNIDSVIKGVSGKMADKLELINRKVLKPGGKLYSLVFYTPTEHVERVRNAVWEAGGGHVGNYSHCSFNSQGKGTFLANSEANPFIGEIGKLHYENEVKTEITLPFHALNKCISALISGHPYEEPVWNLICLNNAHPQYGLGIVGELEEEADAIEFLERIKTTFHCGIIRHTPLCSPRIKKVALCGGAGASFTPLAIKAGADIYISGDFKYHDFFMADNNIIIADIGHYESEQYTKEIFYELVTKKIPNFAVQFSKVNTNPINYL